MLLDPKRQTKGTKLAIVKFLILELLFNENTGCLYAKKLKKITPVAQISTLLD